MSNNDHNMPGLSRRDLLSGAAAATGALVVGFWMPQSASAQIIHPEGAAWAIEPTVKEINAWVVVAPDETVTIRIAQTEQRHDGVRGVAVRLEQGPSAVCVR